MQTETLQPTEAKQYAISQNHQYCSSQYPGYTRQGLNQTYLHGRHPLMRREHIEMLSGPV